MITNPQIGQAVKCISIEPGYSLSPQCLHQVGIITDHLIGGATKARVYVRFPHIVGDRTHWWFFYEHLIFATPEEEQQAKEYHADQQRRQAHADRYL